MAIVVGDKVAEGEVTNASTIDITLTENVPAGNATTAEGLIILTVKNQLAPYPELLDGSDTYCRPASVTDTAPLTGPYLIPNQLLSRMDWQGAFPGATAVGIGPGCGLVNYGGGILFNGAFFYEILDPLSIGDVITIDYSHNPHEIIWLGAKAHRVSGLRGDSPSAPGVAVEQPDSSFANGFAVAGQTFFIPANYAKFIVVAACTWDFDDTTPPYTGITPFHWYGTAGLEVELPIATPLDEVDHFEGTITEQYEGGLTRPWRIGYSFHDFEDRVIEGKLNVYGGGPAYYDMGAQSFLYNESGPGREIPNPPSALALLDPVSFRARA